MDTSKEREAFEKLAPHMGNMTNYQVFQAGVQFALEAKPAPAGCVLVDRGALQMIRLALQRDADDGRTIRGEMLSALDDATHAAPAAPALVPMAIPESGPEDIDYSTGHKVGYAEGWNAAIAASNKT